MRGISLSKEEREPMLAFLAGKGVPEGMGKGSMHWLADELLTVMRLQEPPWAGLADELGKAAFQPGTDPVVRDYIMQYLGHLWEQYGAREEIEKTLWQAVATSDQATPGTALIALSRGYERDGETENLGKSPVSSSCPRTKSDDSFARAGDGSLHRRRRWRRGSKATRGKVGREFGDPSDLEKSDGTTGKMKGPRRQIWERSEEV